MMKTISVLLGLILLAAGPLAGQDAWQLDRSHSSIEFAVTHMVIAEATGRFRDFDMKMTSAGDDFSTARIEAVIKTGSITTDNEYRDNDLLGAGFFDAQKYPEATFKSTKIVKAGEGKYKIMGDLTIRDSTKSVVLDATYFGSMSDPRGGLRMGWKAETTIDRFDFGVAWNKSLETGALVVSKDVRLTIRLEMKKAQPEKKE
jgi:polyisoprenoid-binding protein YceI